MEEAMQTKDALSIYDAAFKGHKAEFRHFEGIKCVCGKPWDRVHLKTLIAVECAARNMTLEDAKATIEFCLTLT